MLTIEDLVQHGMPWHERLATHGAETLSERARERWREAVDPHGLGRFAKRIEWLDEEHGSPADGVRGHPPWLDDLARIRAACSKWVSETTAPPASAAHEPFVDVVWPIAIGAWSDLARSPHAACLSPQAKVDLQVSLVRSLSALLTPTLAELFAQERSWGEVVDRVRSRGKHDAPPDLHYRRFCAELLDGGLQPLLARFPVLGRLIATTVAHWRRSSLEMLRRIAADREKIQDAFRISSATHIERVSGGLSDPHEHGRQVRAVTFGDGRTLVYKPKDLGLEAGLQRFVSFVNERLEHGRLHTLTVLQMEGYGYAEYVEGAPPPAGGDRQLFRNTGRLLAILYLLGASDCHHENVVSSGDQLVVVDAETLLEGDLAYVHDQVDDQHGAQLLGESVIRVGMLPSWMPQEDGPPIDVSALGAQRREGHHRQPTGAPGRWRFVNSDDMYWEPREGAAAIDGPDPWVMGSDEDLRARREALVAGFEEAYRILASPEDRPRLLALLDSCQGLPRRAIIRPTRIYLAIQENATSPSALTSWLERMLRLDQLARAYIASGERPRSWPLLAAEIAALEELDVPRFQHRLGETDLYLGRDVVMENAVLVDGLSAARARLERMSEHDLSWQVTLIEGSMEARSYRMVQRADDRVLGAGSNRSGLRAPTPPQIAEQILAAALRGRDGRLSWLTAAGFGDRARVQFGLAPLGLHDGHAGIAAFLLAVGESEEARATLAPILGALGPGSADQTSKLVSKLGLGLTGAGGLMRLFLFLDDQRPDEGWSARARDLVDALSPGVIAREPELDLLVGVAALAKPLAAMHGRGACDEAPALLEALGRHICLAQDPTTGGWRSGGDLAPLTGWSHGASGIAVALIEAFRVTGSPGFRDAAIRALAYERKTFDGELPGWPDFRGGVGADGPVAMHAWCHGSVGIALARLRLLQLLPEDPEAGRWRRELGTAVELALAAPLTHADHLCCGNLGRVAIIGYLGRKLDRSAWGRSVLRIEERVIERAAAEGGFRSVSATPSGGPPAPGLMTGLSGIGMHLLSKDDDSWIEALLV